METQTGLSDYRAQGHEVVGRARIHISVGSGVLALNYYGILN